METASAKLRQKVLQNFASYVIGVGPGFGKCVGDRIQVKELVCCPRKPEAMIVCEIVVKEDMLNLAEDALHSGCSAYLIDMVTALPFILIALAQEQADSSQPTKFAMAPFSPSHRLDVTYHHAAALGAHLKITCKSVTHSGSLLVVSCEIWDIGEEQLVASAMHCKVMPKVPPPAANLKL